MFSNDNYTVFMITMKIGKQVIPLWFRCFKGNSCSDAFHEELIKEGINYVSNLFTSEDKLIFLADRWLNSISLLQHIDSLGHTYCIRAKSNIKTFYFDKKQGHKIWTQLGYLQSYYKHSNLFYNIEITEIDILLIWLSVKEKVLLNLGLLLLMVNQKELLKIMGTDLVGLNLFSKI